MKTLNNILAFLCDLLPPPDCQDRIALDSVRFTAPEGLEVEKVHELRKPPIFVASHLFSLDRELEVFFKDSRRPLAKVSAENFEEKHSHRLHFLSFL